MGSVSHCAAVPAEREPVVTVYVVGITARSATLEALIGRAGWPVETFASAHEFLDKTGTSDTGCIILDISRSGPATWN